LYTELFYAIIPTLFLCFLLICYPYILLHFNVFFFILVYSKSDGVLCFHYLHMHIANDTYHVHMYDECSYAYISVKQNKLFLFPLRIAN